MNDIVKKLRNRAQSLEIGEELDLEAVDRNVCSATIIHEKENIELDSSLVIIYFSSADNFKTLLSVLDENGVQPSKSSLILEGLYLDDSSSEMADLVEQSFCDVDEQ